MVESWTVEALRAVMGALMGALMGPLYTGAYVNVVGGARDDDASCSSSAHHCLP
jgi:dihydroxyacetone kinase